TCITQYQKKSAAGNVNSAVNRTKTATQAHPEELVPNAEGNARAIPAIGTKSDRFATRPATARRSLACSSGTSASKKSSKVKGLQGITPTRGGSLF
ncbi:MAG: hypothetical protein ACI4ME_11530, partial [Aristaeellaceae bacterium]